LTRHRQPFHPNGDRARYDLSGRYADSDDHPWIAFDIIKEDSCNLKYRAVIALLGCADERYDLNLGNGFMLARSIFSEFRDPGLLADLLAATNKWREKAVYFSGGRLSVGAVESLAEILKCFARDQHCQQRERLERLRYLGCHLAGIGLLGCSMALLNSGHQFWFHFFDPAPNSNRLYQLNKSRLLQTLNASRLCPVFPDDVGTIVACLPERIDLNNGYQSRFWIETQHNTNGMTVMPRNMERYERWLRSRLEACR
jgi:hypothetical protein